MMGSLKPAKSLIIATFRLFRYNSPNASHTGVSISGGLLFHIYFPNSIRSKDTHIVPDYARDTLRSHNNSQVDQGLTAEIIDRR